MKASGQLYRKVLGPYLDPSIGTVQLNLLAQQWHLTPTAWRWPDFQVKGTAHSAVLAYRLAIIQGSPFHLHVCPAGCKVESPLSSWIHNLLEWLTEIREALYVRLCFAMQNTSQTQPKEETWRLRSRSVADTKLPLFSPGVRTHRLPGTLWCVTPHRSYNQGSSSELWCPALLGCHSVDVTGLNPWPLGWPHPPAASWRMGWWCNS